METNLQTAKKDKPRQSSAFNLPAQPGTWRYRFVLAGLLFILLPFIWAAILFLPGSALGLLQLPDFSGLERNISLVIGNPFYILTGIWLLWRPQSARPVALAMAFTAFQKPIAFLVLFGYSQGFPTILLLCSLAFAALATLLWKPVDKPCKRSKLQLVAIVLIVISFLNMPGQFVLSRLYAMKEYMEPFWGPRLQVTELPEKIPQEYSQVQLFGIMLSLPFENPQIATFHPQDSSCILVSDDNLIMLDTPTLKHSIYNDTYYLLEKNVLTMEQKSLTSPSIVYTIFRGFEDCPVGVYKFHNNGNTGFIVPNEYGDRIKLYSPTATNSAEISFRRNQAALDLFTIAAGMDFLTPASADWYFDLGNDYLNKGNNIGAQFSFANACWLEPDNPEYLYMLAKTISENTNPDGTRGGIYLTTAQRLLRQALELNPNYSVVAEFLDELKALEDE